MRLIYLGSLYLLDDLRAILVAYKTIPSDD